MSFIRKLINKIKERKLAKKKAKALDFYKANIESHKLLRIENNQKKMEITLAALIKIVGELKNQIKEKK